MHERVRNFSVFLLYIKTVKKTRLIYMKKSRYLLKETKFAVFAGILSLILGIILLSTSVFFISFNIWTDKLYIDRSLLPIANNLPTFYDIDGNAIEYKSDNYLHPNEIPDNLKYAFIALEDKRFYEHNGFDTYRIAGAMVKNIAKGGAVEGASTITQQLIKNTHLTFEKTISRKLKEIALAQKLEQMYTKDEILSMYLSVIYFGNGAYGVKTASKAYFGKDVAELTLSECATLAGIIKSPTKYSPKNNIENALHRRNIVLNAMYEQGYITHSQMTKATYENINIKENKNTDISKFFIDRAVEQVCKIMNLTKYQFDNSGLAIYTTYSPVVQEILDKNSDLNCNFSKKNVPNSSIIIDNRTGYVLAYSSSLGYEIFRQAGSTLKPLVVYAPAIEMDIITLATPIDDNQITIGDWTPKNYGDKYVGITNVRDAIKQSSNTVAAKVASYIGENKIYYYGNLLGLTLTKDDKNLTVSLGATSKGQSPLQIASAYSTFANEGRKQETTFIRYIVNNEKKTYAYAPTNQQVFSKETAYLVTDCLIDTVKSGTAITLSSLPFAIASKTGTASTSNGKNTDAWNVSYTPNYTLAVWHGDADETGGGHPTRHALSIWSDLHQTANYNLASRFDSPENIINLPIDIYSTNKLNHVSIATENTPRRYVKNEIFKKSNRSNFETSIFEATPLDFEVSVENYGKTVEISFWGEDIFNYQIIRNDILGERIIGNIIGYGSYVTFYDAAILSGVPVEYKLIAYTKEQSTPHISGSCTKKIII